MYYYGGALSSYSRKGTWDSKLVLLTSIIVREHQTEGMFLHDYKNCNLSIATR